MNFDQEYRTQIKPEHIDTFGHVNNAVYLQLLEEARWDWIHKGGGNRQLIQEMGVGPIVVEITIRFSRELKEGETISIQSQTEGEIGRTYTMNQFIYKPNGELACRAKFRMAFLDLNERRIVEAPAVWREILSKPSRMKENVAQMGA